MDFYDSKDWRFLKYPLCVFGVWPSQPIGIKVLFCSLVSIGFLILYVAEAIKLIWVRHNIILVTDCVPIFGIHTAAFCKLFCCIFNSHKVKELLLIMKQDCTSESLSKEELDLLRNRTAEGNRQIQMYTGCVYMAATCVLMIAPWIPKVLDIILPLNESRPRPILYNTEYLVDDKYLDYIHIYEYLISPFPTIIICSYDSVFAVTCLHTCNKLYLLGCRFKNIVTTLEEQSDKRGKLSSKILGQYVADHKAILRYIEVYHEVFSTSSLVSIIFTVITLVLTGIQCLVRKDDLNQVFRFGSCATGIMFQILFISICGQKFIDYSENLLLLTTQSEWYRLPLNLQKAMIILTIEFSRPNLLKVGKILTISFESFTSIMRLTMSYFTVANAVFL